MAYQTARTIKEVIGKIDDKKYLLPAIQREFVWKTDQIENLFDSLMQGYPISTFLFWKVERPKFQLYAFLNHYHEWKKRHNERVNLNGIEEVTAVLDGQQRLNSLYIGLRGSYAYRMSNKRYYKDASYPERSLYLNLLFEPNPDVPTEKKYQFAFLTKEEAKKRDEKHFWFKVGEILNYTKISEVIKYGHEVNMYLHEQRLPPSDLPLEVLSILYEVVHKDRVIAYYEESSNELDRVLNIFVRINSGGTKLRHSDLLLSIATSQWEKLNAREEIVHLVDEINRTGEGFNFDNDFVLKSCLVLSDFKGIEFKVDNFNKSNMEAIEEKWETIKEAIRMAVQLLLSFGYDGSKLMSTFVVIPIAYYILKKELTEKYVESTHYIEDRKEIQKWLMLALLRAVYKDRDLILTRDVIKNSSHSFPLDGIIDQFRHTSKSLVFSKEDIEVHMHSLYRHRRTFTVLSLLYPFSIFQNRPHVDHIFPRTLLSNEKYLIEKGVPEDKFEKYKEYTDRLANLQLLPGLHNQEKSCKDFNTWLHETYKDERDRKGFKRMHLIPDVDLSITNFIEFFEEREKMIKAKLTELLTQKEAEAARS